MSGTPLKHARVRLLAEFVSFAVPVRFLDVFAELKFSGQESLLAKSVLHIEGTARPIEVQVAEYCFASIACARALLFRSRLKNYTVGPFQIGIIKSLEWTRTPPTPSAYFRRMFYLGTARGSARFFRIAARRSGALNKGRVDFKMFADFYNGIGNFIPNTLKYHEVLLHVADCYRAPVRLSEIAAARLNERVSGRLQRIRQLVGGGEALDAVVMLSKVSEKSIIFSQYFGSPAEPCPVIHVPRPVGSTLKIALYSAVLDRCAVNKETLIEDEPIQITWRGESISPRNADRQFRGQVSLEYAFANSINIPAIKLVQMLGIENFVDYLRKCGVQRPLPNSPLIALGAAPLTGQELLSTIAPILTGGVSARPKIAAHRREISYFEGERIISLETCKTMKQLLKASIACGTAKFLGALPNPGLGGKTGTSEGNRDLWFMGALTEDISGLVWIGFRDGRTISSLDGKDASSSRFAVPLWSEVVSVLLDGALPSFLNPTTN